MTDFSDYIDWCDHYGDNHPDDFGNMDDYVSSILKDTRPVNYDAWKPLSQGSLDKQLEGFYDLNKPAKAAFKKKAKRVGRAKSRSGMAKRLVFRTKRKLSKTEQKTLRTIEKKRTEDKAFNRTEMKLTRQLVFFRARELVDKQGYKWADAMKRAWEEYKR